MQKGTTVEKYSEKETANARREPMSEEVIKFALALAVRTDELASRVLVKLEPVMTQEMPCPAAESCSPARDWPPLFTTLRETFFSIQQSLEVIEDALGNPSPTKKWQGENVLESGAVHYWYLVEPRADEAWLSWNRSSHAAVRISL